MSPGGGREVVLGFAVYCASGFALEGLADAFRFDLSMCGIDSVLVELGVHRTRMLEKSCSRGKPCGPVRFYR